MSFDLCAMRRISDRTLHVRCSQASTQPTLHLPVPLSLTHSSNAWSCESSIFAPKKWPLRAFILSMRSSWLPLTVGWMENDSPGGRFW